MRKFRFDKLVRDKILEDMIKNGQEPVYKTLDDKEYVKELKNKILEEAQEIPLASEAELVSEVADVEEAIYSLLKILGIKRSEITKIRNLKNKARGAFNKRIYVKSASAPGGSKFLEYYLKFPQKYPEIKK